MAERAYAPWTDLEAQHARRAGVPLFSVDTHRAGRRLRRPRLQPRRPSSSTRTCSNCIDLAGVPGAGRRPPARAPAGRSPAATAPTTPSRWPTSSTSFVIGDGEEVGRRDHRGRRRVEGGRARTAREGVLRELADDPRRLRAVDVRRRLRRAVHRRGARPATPTCPTASRSAPSPTWPSGPTRSSQLVPLTEVVHDRLNVEVFRGCTRGCRFCQAGMITRPVRERPGRAGAHDGRARACGAPATTRSRSPRCRRADFSGIERRRRRASSTTRRAAAASACRCRRLRVDAFTVGIAGEIQKARRTGLTFAPEARHVADAPGHQQAHPRGGPLRRGRRRRTRRAGGG